MKCFSHLKLNSCELKRIYRNSAFTRFLSDSSDENNKKQEIFKKYKESFIKDMESNVVKNNKYVNSEPTINDDEVGFLDSNINKNKSSEAVSNTDKIKYAKLLDEVSNKLKEAHLYGDNTTTDTYAENYNRIWNTSDNISELHKESTEFVEKTKDDSFYASVESNESLGKDNQTMNETLSESESPLYADEKVSQEALTSSVKEENDGGDAYVDNTEKMFLFENKEEEFDRAYDQEKKQKLFESVKLLICGHDESVIKSYLEFIKMTVINLEITVSPITVIPYYKYMRTLLRSPHIHKRARVQYEWRTYKRSITFYRLTENNANVVLSYLQYNIPEGVAMEVEYKSIQPYSEHINV